MKPHLFVVALLLSAGLLRAQSITVGTIAKLSYCVGDPITVPYTTNGKFGSDNTFIVQLSGANGSFSTFTDMGTMTADNATFSFALTTSGTFQVRVISTDPMIMSSDNGQKIIVSSLPSPDPWTAKFDPNFTFKECSCFLPAGMIDEPIRFGDHASEPPGSTFTWIFGPDASTDTTDAIMPTVSFSTPGTKSASLTVTAPGGCSTTSTFGFKVLSCNPVIPADAHIVTSVERGSDSIVWVKAGGSYTTSSNSITQTIFAEPGAIVIDQGGESYTSSAILYLRAGSSYTLDKMALSSVVTDANNTANISPNAMNVFTCDNLSFDYSLLPDSVRPFFASVPSKAPLKEVLLNDNNFVVQFENGIITMKVFSLLGTQILIQQGSGTLDLDLSLLPAGVYFAVVQAGGEETVRKIAIVH